MAERNTPPPVRVGALAFAAALLAVAPVHAQPASAAGQNIDVEVRFADEAERRPVPFELVQNHILFKARVDGQEVWALLDNGFDHSTIDLGFARSRRIAFGDPVGQGATPTGRIEMRLAPGVPIELPGQMRFRPPVMVADLSSLSRDIGLPVALVLGGDSFAFLSYFVSPSQRSFLVAPSRAMTAPPGSAELVLRNGRAQLEVAIEGRPALLTVDLGDDHAISLGAAAAKRLGLDLRPGIAAGSRGAEGGTMATHTVIAEEVAIGPGKAEKVPVTIRPAMLAAMGDGTIGMGIFANSNFVVDVAAQRIWLLSPVGASTAEIGAAARSAARLHKAGLAALAERQFADLRARASRHEDLNALCWAKATAGVLLDSAIRDCEEAVSQSGGDAGHLDSLGMALLQSGRLRESVAAYGRAIDKAQPASAYYGRALAEARLGDMASAEADLAQARKRDPAIDKVYADIGLPLVLPAKPGRAR